MINLQKTKETSNVATLDIKYLANLKSHSFGFTLSTLYLLLYPPEIFDFFFRKPFLKLLKKKTEFLKSQFEFVSLNLSF